ncbi:centriolin-like [Stegastes partitus]|uniref:Centriolin-like n=1 Tax=Stegastes partitus TaxID=144197 RepID=A0A9Y4NQ33_9TELE|nr:PREDICTED: centriolin-like [Stegastes partitus]
MVIQLCEASVTMVIQLCNISYHGDLARCSEQQVLRLQAENQSLQLHLEDAQRHCRQLENSARSHTQNASVQQGELCLLQKEAQALRERQVESSRQQAELEAELHLLREELSRQVTLGQAHVTSQLVDRMSGKHSELEGRLDDLLSRIAMETQEIKELEQQLTNGQILANEALQRDLEEVICGLQEYLRGLRQQARRSEQQVLRLQAENQSLQLHLEDAQRHCRQLENSARSHTQNASVQQGELCLLQKEAQALRERQVESSRQQAELEAELHLLREELSRQVTLGQFQCEALQAAAHKEKQSGEFRECQLQSTIHHLQEDKSSLQQLIQCLQVQLSQSKAQLDHTRAQLDHSRAQLDPSALSDYQEDTLSRDSTEQQNRTSRHNRASRRHVDQDQSDGHRRSLDRLDRKLRQLGRSMSAADQLTAEQLEVSIEQLRALNLTVELLQAQVCSSTATRQHGNMATRQHGNTQ